MVRWNDQLVALCEAARAARAGLPPLFGASDRPFAWADPLVLFAELRKYADRGWRFLEWGSGVGTITIMADLLGYRACGIERDVRLVEVAKRLAQRSGSAATFGLGNFVPVGVDPNCAPAVPAEFALAGGGADGYAEISCRPSDFDIVYVFPHPELIDATHDLFARIAKPGARLLLYVQSMEILMSLRTPDGATPLTPA